MVTLLHWYSTNMSSQTLTFPGYYWYSPVSRLMETLKWYKKACNCKAHWFYTFSIVLSHHIPRNITHIRPSVWFSVCWNLLSVCMPVCLSVGLSLCLLESFICMYVCLSVRTFCLSEWLSLSRWVKYTRVYRTVNQ